MSAAAPWYEAELYPPGLRGALGRAPDLARAGARPPDDRLIPAGARETEGLAAEARDGARRAAGGRPAEERVIPARARELGAREVDGLATDARDRLRVGARRVAVGRLLRVAGAERAPRPARVTRDDGVLCDGRVAGTVLALCPKRVVLLLGCALDARLRAVVADEVPPSLDALGVARLVGRVVRWATSFLVIGVVRPVARA